MRAQDAEQQRRMTSERVEAERVERIRVESLLHRSEERLLDEQVRAAVAEERWQPLVKQRDDAQRERSRAARALNALHAEKRELQWAIGDQAMMRTLTPLRAWDTPKLGAAAGLDVPPFPPRSNSTFSSSPFAQPLGGFADGGYIHRRTPTHESVRELGSYSPSTSGAGGANSSPSSGAVASPSSGVPAPARDNLTARANLEVAKTILRDAAAATTSPPTGTARLR